MEVQIPPNYGPRYTKLFTDSFKTIADETDSELMPFFMLSIAGRPELMQNDNLHPNADAQPLIRDFMYKTINDWLD
jgi:acyl-CoA thioesterase-1